MKAYTHAWIAFKAIERLDKSNLGSKQEVGKSLISWLKNHRDGVIQGAWYPDSIIKDNANSHVYKFSPVASGETFYRKLQSSNMFYVSGQESEQYGKPYKIDVNDNLPNRCEALAHSIVDNLKIQESEQKGSSIPATDNHIALRLFMLSHYVADAHMPFHCDSRSFSSGNDLHAEVEKKWEDEIEIFYAIDQSNERFFYDPEGYPIFKDDDTYQGTVIHDVNKNVKNRKFVYSWGGDNSNVLEFLQAICQYSYLLSYSFIPKNTNSTEINTENWDSISEQKVKFHEMSVIALTEAIESVARIWLRVWHRYQAWLN